MLPYISIAEILYKGHCYLNIEGRGVHKVKSISVRWLIAPLCDLNYLWYNDLVGRKPGSGQLGRNSKHKYLCENPVKHESNQNGAWNKDNSMVLILDGFSE